ncbi:helix-turn-helix domain-containing protein [Vagococcus fessus]|uniref:HTH cro/C1-type domain-containing protein n=1 Tax=Vagococcus fessus TaxID=120370 RepID=A0A430A546_9ENTE|nr:helix-turn-helix transcriptional regulator [Vagococcus fessus]RSU01930.1 hypothetical protein CBF31_09175 [Vagococcus fessus]
MSIGQRIKDRRKELNISADKIAEKLNVSRSTIFRYEKGDIGKVPTEVIVDLADILQTTPGYLMGWSGKNGEMLVDEDSTYFDNTIDIMRELSTERKLDVYNFAKEQLEEQNSKVIKLERPIVDLTNEVLYALDGKDVSEEDRKKAEEAIQAHLDKKNK